MTSFNIDNIEGLNEFQLAEVEILQSAYSDIFMIERISLLNDNNDNGLEVIFKLINFVNNNTIRIVLPSSYPISPLSCVLIETNLPLINSIEIKKKINSIAFESSLDEICCSLLIIQTIKDYIEDYEINKIKQIIKKDDNNEIKKVIIVRVFIYFHHIKSERKKKEIVNNAKELNLSGLWKEGFPGLLLAEGNRDDINEYIRILKSLKWQKMTV